MARTRTGRVAAQPYPVLPEVRAALADPALSNLDAHVLGGPEALAHVEALALIGKILPGSRLAKPTEALPWKTPKALHLKRSKAVSRLPKDAGSIERHQRDRIRLLPKLRDLAPRVDVLLTQPGALAAEWNAILETADVLSLPRLCRECDEPLLVQALDLRKLNDPKLPTICARCKNRVAQRKYHADSKLRKPVRVNEKSKRASQRRRSVKRPGS